MLDTKAIEIRFQEFQEAMFHWETHFYPLMKDNTAKYIHECKDALKKIFDEYVYNYRTDYGRMTGPDTGFPPEYDPQTDSIEKIMAGRTKVTIYVQKTTGFKENFRFTLGEHDEKWMIEKKEIFWKAEKKWGKFEL